MGMRDLDHPVLADAENTDNCIFTNQSCTLCIILVQLVDISSVRKHANVNFY
jgi:hypothetical protein